jgi:spermidine/putrescine transport system permease protein
MDKNNRKIVKPRKTFKDLIGPLVTLLPITLWMLAFFVIPVFLIIIISFFTRGEVGNVEPIFTFSNYKDLISPRYLVILWRSLVVSIGTTVGCLLLGYPFAFFTGRAKKKLRPVLMMLIIVPFWTNSLIRTYAWIILLRTEGIINSVLLNLHIISAPMQMLYTDAAVIVGMIYIMFPFMVLPLFSSIEKLDNSLIEAAFDLGATPVNVFRKVILPLTKSGIMSGCLLVFVPTLGLFFISDLMGGSKITLLSNLIKNQFLASRNWPFGSAIAVVLIVIMLILILLYTKLGGTKDKMEVL